MIDAPAVAVTVLLSANWAVAIGVVSHPGTACFSGAAFAITVDIPPVVKASIVIKILLCKPVIAAITDFIRQREEFL